MESLKNLSCIYHSELRDQRYEKGVNGMASNDQYENILFEEHGPVRLLTMNRPESLNAITPQMEKEIHHALDVAEEDEEARVVIINGAGRAFSAGYDIGGVKTETDEETFPLASLNQTNTILL